jgi:hypothetical protein
MEGNIIFFEGKDLIDNVTWQFDSEEEAQKVYNKIMQKYVMK